MESFKALKLRISTMPIFQSPLFIKYNRLIIPGIVLIIAIFILTLVTIPQVFKLIETFRTIDELNTKKVFYQKKIADLESLDLEKYRKDLETSLVALPVDRDIPGVTGELLVALSGSGMSLSGIAFSSASPESDKVQEYSLKLEVSGSEDSLKNFFERVKISPRIIKIVSLDISQGKTQTLNASLGFVTLYQALPQHIGSVDADIPTISSADSQTLVDIAAKIRTLPQVTETEASTSAVGKSDPFSK